MIRHTDSTLSVVRGSDSPKRSIREGIYPGVKHVGLPGHYQALVRLEPCALKGARTVLRGLETGNCLWLLCEI
ncbi:hypothetical protein, partial [Photorhabdus khanii]|uniref:hypothetical protein n=1 Tax=Photorhabdus khanii TaxID=1004150 RepID=UPI00196186AA